MASFLYIIFCFNPSFEKLLFIKMFVEGEWLYPSWNVNFQLCYETETEIIYGSIGPEPYF